MKKRLHFTVFITVLTIMCLNAQEEYWGSGQFREGTQGVSLKGLVEENYNVFQLNIEALKSQLTEAPLRNQSNGVSNTIVGFPSVNGKIESYRVVEAPVLSEDIALLYPEIKTYMGSRTDNSGTRIRFSITPLGLKAMISSPGEETVFIQPVTKVSNGQYLVYNRNARVDSTESFECLTEDLGASKEVVNDVASRDANDQLLRTFRMAISTTGEYTNFWDDGNAGNGNAQSDALAEVVSTLNRMNEVFEVDMAITFTLVSGTNVIYTNPVSDPYTNNPNGQLQATLTSQVGEANYDIGHLFMYAGNNGNAGCIGCVCQDNQKGSGFSAHTFLDNNGGPYMSDFFDIDYVPHEVGHQMGANHTFAFNTEGSGVNSEPGSGTTIMGYAGITGGNDVQDHSDPYFHYHSINQILNNVASAPNNCATTTSISNNPPVANAGADYFIPNGTAFVLKGAATDPDASDVLTYTWEQIDSGNTTNGSFGPTHTGPIWRSRPPSVTPDRYMPIFSRVLAEQLTESSPVETIDNSSWETVSTIARTLNFALTVRDRAETGGIGQSPQSDFDLMTVTVEGGSPFTVVTPPAWGSGSSQTVIWNVGTTNNATINCQLVNIKFSTDGGLTFPTTLASNTANDGSETINVPSVPDTNNARILVEAADNIFYALSSIFPISSVPSFALNNSSGPQSACGIDFVDYSIDFFTVNGFSENTVLSATGNPGGSNVSFSPANLNGDGTSVMTISNLTGAAAGDYIITVTGTSSSVTNNIDVTLTVVNGLCTSVANTTYQTSTTLVQFGSINQASGKPSGYSDYTAVSTDMYQDSSYDLTVNMNTDGDYLCTTNVWIDWNQNCIFESGEEYDLGSAVNVVNGASANSPLSITIPSDAKVGVTTMRVTTKYNSAASACENGHDAEVEDYSINVLASLSVEEFGNTSDFVVYPNPNNGYFVVKFTNNGNNDINISIYDIRGRRVFNNIYGNDPEFNEEINLGVLQSGMYLLKVSNGEKVITKKILVE